MTLKSWPYAARRAGKASATLETRVKSIRLTPTGASSYQSEMGTRLIRYHAGDGLKRRGAWQSSAILLQAGRQTRRAASAGSEYLKAAIDGDRDKRNVSEAATGRIVALGGRIREASLGESPA